MPVALVESRPVAEALTPADGPGRFLVQLITPGWGSSGYYAQDVLESAARDRIWPAGTHMYLDHPTESETWERPERSVKDLVAVLEEDARWDPTRGALVAEARVFSRWRQPLAEMLDAIGVSIRGAAEGDLGEVDGRTGRVFTRLVEGTSVDFVTKAGRGGRVLQILESTRTSTQEARNVGQWVESRIHRDFTVLADEMFGDGRLTRDERITLSGGIGDALAAFVARIEADAPGLYERDIWDEPPTPGTSDAVENGPTSVPSRPAGQSTATESQEDTMATTQIEESRLAQLEKDAGRATALESERAAAVQRAEEAEAKLAEARKTANTAVAERVVREAFDAAGVTAPKTITRLAASAPLTDTGDVDEAALKTAAEESAAELAEGQGAGRVRGFGTPTRLPEQGGTDDLSEAELDAEIARISGRTIKEA